MDLVQACRAFVAVADRGSFTAGAAATDMSQPVASRRIAALERELAGPLLDRAGRRPRLTPLGRRLLPTARRLTALAESLREIAADAHAGGIDLAVPQAWEVREIAALALAAQDHDVRLSLVQGGPAERAQLFAAHHVHATIEPRPHDTASWSVELGAATAVATTGRVHLAALRLGRRGRAAPRLWLLPEDDVPHVRDPLTASTEAAGLSPHQLRTGAPGSAVAAALGSHDLVICTRAEADRWQLAWAPFPDLRARRGYALVGPAEVLDRVGPALSSAVHDLMTGGRRG